MLHCIFSSSFLATNVGDALCVTRTQVIKTGNGPYLVVSVP